MKRSSNFIVSLDLELYWGLHDVRSLDSYRANLVGQREAVVKTLDLFEAYGVHATWAAVGMLMAEDRDDCLASAPEARPTYSDPRRDPYRLLASSAATGTDARLLFAPDLIRRILETPNQELGTHTFSHFYCLEPGQTIEQFRADLRAARRLGERFGRAIESIVFPRNQFAGGYVRACAEEGILAMRGNPNVAIYRGYPQEDLPLWVRGLRLADSFVPVIPLRDTSFVPAPSDGIVDVQQSRFFRPFGGRRAAHAIRVRRILAELRGAVARGRDYHLWWHPHNFGVNVEENLAALEDVLRHVAYLEDLHGLRSRTMGEVAREALSA